MHKFSFQGRFSSADDSFTFIQILNRQRKVAFNIRVGDDNSLSVTVRKQLRFEHGLKLTRTLVSLGIGLPKASSPFFLAKQCWSEPTIK